MFDSELYVKKIHVDFCLMFIILLHLRFFLAQENQFFIVVNNFAGITTFLSINSKFLSTLYHMLLKHFTAKKEFT